MSERQPAFGEAVKELIARHGLSQNAASIRSGIDRFTLSRMAAGIVPRLELLEQFARAFDEDINQWRELGGFPRLSDQDWSELMPLAREIDRIRREVGVDFEVSTSELLGRFSGEEQRRDAVRRIRERAEEKRRQAGAEGESLG